MSRQVRLAEMVGEYLQLREEYEELRISSVSGSTPVFEEAREAIKALDVLIQVHESLVQKHRFWIRNQ